MSVFSNSKAIWSNDLDTVNQYVLFKNKFSVQDTKVNLIINISIDNRYSIFINGNWIEAQQYSDYDFYKVYDSINIPNEYLVEGENTLSILAYCQNEDSSTYRKGSPSLIFEVADDEVVYATSDENTLYTKNTGFVSGEIERFSLQVSFGFKFNFELENNVEYFNSLIVPKKEKYYKRAIKQLKIEQPTKAKIIAQGVFKNSSVDVTPAQKSYEAYLKHIPFTSICEGEKTLPSDSGILFKKELIEDDGIYLVSDMLTEQAGYLMLDMEFSTPTNVEISFGEHLDDLRVRSFVGGRCFAVSCKFNKGRNKFLYPIKRIGARYLQIHVYTDEFKLYYAGVRPVNYPVKLKEKPANLNSLQSKIYDVSIHTLRSSMHEHYEDCPWREQALYAMDSYNAMLCSFAGFEDCGVYARENIRLLGLGQREDGLLELCGPARVGVVIPSFSLIWILALGEYLRKSKDIQFASEMIEIANKILRAFKNSENGLIYNPIGLWNFYEWKPYLDGISVSNEGHSSRDGKLDAPLNALYIFAIKELSNVYMVLEDKEKADEIAQRYEELKAQYNKAFWCEENKAYSLSTDEKFKNIFPELGQALSLCADLCVNEEDKNQLIERLKNSEFQPNLSLSHRIFLYNALLKDEKSHEFILKDIETRWGDMLFKGATTFWETDIGADDFEYAGSLCHGWSALPIYIYQTINNQIKKI